MLSADELIFGYMCGVFPMADSSEENAIYWYDPQQRGIIPLDGLIISKSLGQTLRNKKFNVTMNTAFEEVIRACANRTETWISEEIIEAYTSLHEMGFAYSFETRNKENKLVGGLYGVAIGKAFFGESMFHTERDASKVALVHLVRWLSQSNFLLLDTQYITEHLKSLGGIEISREEYRKLLAAALGKAINNDRKD